MNFLRVQATNILQQTDNVRVAQVMKKFKLISFHAIDLYVIKLQENVLPYSVNVSNVMIMNSYSIQPDVNSKCVTTII